MRRVLLALILGLVLPAHAHAAVPDGTGRLLVTLKPAAAPGHAAARAAAVHAVASAAGARPSGFSVPQIRLVTVSPRPGESLHALAARLRADPRVASVAAERRAALRFQPNDPALVTPETAKDTAPGHDGRVVGGAQRLPAGLGHQPGRRGDGRRHRHRRRDRPPRARRARRGPRLVRRRALARGTRHESATARTSRRSRARPGTTASGSPAPGSAASSWSSSPTSATRASPQSIVWAVDHGADAINMSFGTDPGATPSLPVLNAIDYAVAHGVVLVAAAADDPIEDQGYPANVLQPTGTGARPQRRAAACRSRPPTSSTAARRSPGAARRSRSPPTGPTTATTTTGRRGSSAPSPPR